LTTKATTIHRHPKTMPGMKLHQKYILRYGEDNVSIWFCIANMMTFFAKSK